MLGYNHEIEDHIKACGLDQMDLEEFLAALVGTRDCPRVSERVEFIEHRMAQDPKFARCVVHQFVMQSTVLKEIREAGMQHSVLLMKAVAQLLGMEVVCLPTNGEEGKC